MKRFAQYTEETTVPQAELPSDVMKAVSSVAKVLKSYKAQNKVRISVEHNKNVFDINVEIRDRNLLDDDDFLDDLSDAAPSGKKITVSTSGSITPSPRNVIKI